MKKLAFALATPLLLIGLAGPAWAAAPDRSGGIPWWAWLVGIMGLGGLAVGGMAVSGVRQQLAALRIRLDALDGPRQRILAGGEKLADVSVLSRFQDGEARAACEKLADACTRVTAQARAFGDRYAAADASVALTRDFDATGRLIDELEREAVPLEAELAGAVTALATMEGGGVTADDLAGLDLPERMRRAGHEWMDLRATRERFTERALAGAVAIDVRAASALDAAHAAITSHPVDPVAADQWLEEARQVLASYEEALKADEAQRRQAEARRVEAAGRRAMEADRARAQAAWKAATSPAPKQAPSTYRPSYRSSANHSASAGAGGSSADAGWESGSSADSSWESGASADSGWDSGSSAEPDKPSGGSSNEGSW